MVFIYILKLQQEKYYIGKTENPSFRLNSHFNSNGSAWTKKYLPIKLLKLIPNCDKYDEDKHTKIYMDKYGIDNVRGGSYVSIKLNKSVKEELERTSDANNDKCFICKKKGHFAQDCYEYSSEEEELWCCQYCDKQFDTEKGVIFHENVYCKRKPKNPYYKPKQKTKSINCYRCNREGHYSSSCYANTDINGYYID